MTSQIRQNFQDECITGINNVINTYMRGAYCCMSLWQYFCRDDMALYNVGRFFECVGEIKSRKARQLICYMNQRGGRVIFKDITAPEKNEWGTVQEACEKVLECEKTLNQELLRLHDLAEKNKDWQLCDYLEKNFLKDMVKHIEELGWIITNLRRVGKGVGEFLFDAHYFTDTGKIHTPNLVNEDVMNRCKYLVTQDVKNRCLGGMSVDAEGVQKCMKNFTIRDL
ncbi:ferritin-like domain-containing protein [Ditylenchus destructor]|uniref:Ferritin n=1 Tax=Ditylenchus destructor TaxID=166010 RepID=A0AAD4MPQ3_9BILA|nr:ferritin-like domain-containing protein [Ditylenchus destructor]